MSPGQKPIDPEPAGATAALQAASPLAAAPTVPALAAAFLLSLATAPAAGAPARLDCRAVSPDCPEVVIQGDPFFRGGAPTGSDKLLKPGCDVWRIRNTVSLQHFRPVIREPDQRDVCTVTAGAGDHADEQLPAQS